ncbi:MAG: hypothetical protein OXC45_04905 [Gemmatimonadetes bacterium]|nr:hypothetical protein [Gemmatimonadota bacterium]
MLLDLLTLADSNFPTGGYAFSNGLEAAKQMGLLRSSDDLDAYMQTVIHATARSEIPFINACFKGDPLPENLTDMLLTYDAMLTAPAIARGSEVQGRNLLRLMCDLYFSDAMARLHKILLSQPVPAHYTIVFGMTFRIAGLKHRHTCRIFMYQFLRDQISAAVRLGQIGPMEAARLQKRHHKTAIRAMTSVAQTDYTCATRCAPQWDIAQGMHEFLYSRLFQS